MARKNLIRTKLYPYHITTRSNHKFWFNLSLDKVWEIAIESIQKAMKKYPVEIFQFVLMNNHYHLFLRTPDENIDLFMYELNKYFSLKLREKTNLINRMFGGRYKWSIITDKSYAYNVYRYIYQNPIKANITKRCEDYPYSTLHYEFYKISSPFKTFSLFDNTTEELIEWVNANVPKEEDELIRKGLSKTTFNITKERATRTYQTLDHFL